MLASWMGRRDDDACDHFGREIYVQHRWRPPATPSRDVRKTDAVLAREAAVSMRVAEEMKSGAKARTAV
jgi:hypothetical protein